MMGGQAGRRRCSLYAPRPRHASRTPPTAADKARYWPARARTPPLDCTVMAIWAISNTRHQHRRILLHVMAAAGGISPRRLPGDDMDAMRAPYARAVSFSTRFADYFFSFISARRRPSSTMPTGQGGWGNADADILGVRCHDRAATFPGRYFAVGSRYSLALEPSPTHNDAARLPLEGHMTRLGRFRACCACAAFHGGRGTRRASAKMPASHTMMRATARAGFIASSRSEMGRTAFELAGSRGRRANIRLWHFIGRK